MTWRRGPLGTSDPRRRIFWLAAVALLLTGCSIGTRSSSAPTATDTTAANTSAARTVDIKNQAGADEFVFKPHKITVRVGTRVTWLNRSVQPHTVTAKGRVPAFDSGTQKLIEPKQSYSFVFRHAGKYKYYCLLHPYMTGVVVVQP